MYCMYINQRVEISNNKKNRIRTILISSVGLQVMYMDYFFNSVHQKSFQKKKLRNNYSTSTVMIIFVKRCNATEISCYNLSFSYRVYCSYYLVLTVLDIGYSL